MTHVFTRFCIFVFTNDLLQLSMFASIVFFFRIEPRKDPESVNTHTHTSIQLKKLYWHVHYRNVELLLVSVEFVLTCYNNLNKNIILVKHGDERIENTHQYNLKDVNKK